jgi:hypothetical protein
LPALLGTARVGEWEGMGRRLRRFDSHPHLGLGRREKAAPRAAADCRRCWLGATAFEGFGEGEVAGEVRGATRSGTVYL